jgi:hypothetical protein
MLNAYKKLNGELPDEFERFDKGFGIRTQRR